MSEHSRKHSELRELAPCASSGPAHVADSLGHSFSHPATATSRGLRRSWMTWLSRVFELALQILTLDSSHEKHQAVIRAGARVSVRQLLTETLPAASGLALLAFGFLVLVFCV